jgi:imidazolonepropionase-like amidohydrolase
VAAEVYVSVRFLMRATSLLIGAVAASVVACASPPPSPSSTLFRGARLITGDGRAPIENGALLVQGDRITFSGPVDDVVVPSEATIVDLRGKTVMPALIDGHSHLGYTDVRAATTSASNYTLDNLRDHLERYAYYGVAATLSLGLDRGELPYALRDERRAGTALFLTAGRGIATPGAGPRADYWKDAAYGVRTEPEARAAVRELAAKKVDMLKIWVDDRDKTVTPLPPSLYRPIIDEAHALGLRVVAHVYYLADAKELLRAGVDGFAHGIRDTDVDDEILALFRERPNVFLLPNLPDTPPGPGDVESLAGTLPREQIALLERSTPPARPALFAVQARSLPRLHAAGVTIGFGTDAGIGAPYGWSAHAELADMVAAGLTPSQALTAATSTSARILGLDQAGTLAAGKSADFIVLDANPLDDIRHTRRIAQVYLRGVAVDRVRLREKWTRSSR